MKEILGFLGARARERTTWVGISMIAGALGIHLNPEQLLEWVLYGFDLLGGLLVVAPEKKSDKK